MSMRRFDEFAVGDYVYFERTFTEGDFAVFAELSGDRSPLHHDPAYGASSEFGRTIAPLHLVAAPLSMIVGMLLPGEPALYLDHRLTAARPVHYGETLGYSARVSAINQSHRVLTLRVLVFRASEIVLEGRLNAQVREEAWPAEGPSPVRRAKADPWALVTGATGAIGSAVCARLADAGWHLLAHHRAADGREVELAATCRGRGVSVELLQASLDTEAGRHRLLDAAAKVDNLGLVVHAACPPIDAPLGDLVAVEYEALRGILATVTPVFLRRQDGAVLVLGSTALQQHPVGWDHYVAAKSMAVGLANAFHAAYGRYGLRGLTLAPGYVGTAFSERHRPKGAVVLTPEQVASEVVEAVSNPPQDGTYIMLEPGCRRVGVWGFHTAAGAAERRDGS